MEPAGDGAGIEAILREVGRCRRLAAALLAGPGAADVDDVLQEASLAALSATAPRGAGLRPWLAGVVRHLAIGAWRRRTRREAHERVAAPHLAFAPAADALHERMELHHALLRAVEELAEPYRSTVVRRWLDGATPQWIADADGLPLATVKTRLRRGLERLRERMKREWGDRLEGGLALMAAGIRAAPGVPPAAATATSNAAAGATAATGAVIVGIQAKSVVLAMAACVAIAGVATWAWLEGDKSGRANQRDATEVAATSGIGEATAPNATAVRVAEAPGDAARDGAPSSVTAPSPVAGRIGGLRGRVVDVSGTPVVAARVVAAPKRLDLPRSPARHDVAALPTSVRIASTDGGGRFTFDDLPRGILIDLAASGPAGGLVERKGVLADESDEVELLLAPTTELRGVVVDALDGDRPVAGARVEVMRTTIDPAISSETTTDLQGRFVLHAVTGMRAIVMATTEDGRCSAFESYALVPGGAVEIEVAVAGAGRIEGVVLSAIDRAPIAGAEIELRAFLATRGPRTDRDGRFALESRVRFDEGMPVIVRAPGFASLALDLPPTSEQRDRLDVSEVRLEPERTIRGRLVARDGKPLVGVVVTAMPVEGKSDGTGHCAVTDAAGAFRIGQLKRSRHLLVVSGEHIDQRRAVVPEREEGQAEVDVGTVALGRGALLAGVILDEGGAPIRVESIVLRPATSAPPRFGVGENDPEVVRVACVPDGRFACSGVPAGRWRADVKVPHVRQPCSFEIDVAEEALLDDLRFTVTSGGVIDGIVVDAHGSPMARVQVALFDPRTPPHAQHGPIDYQRTRTDAAGRFSFLRLVPPEFRLVAEPTPPSRVGGSRALPNVIERVSTGTRDLRIELPDGEVIAGRVVTTAGAPAVHAWVVAVAADGTMAASMTTDEEGRFELLLAPDQVATVEVRRAQPHFGGTVSGAVVVSLPDVLAGETDLQLTLPDE